MLGVWATAAAAPASSLASAARVPSPATRRARCALPGAGRGADARSATAWSTARCARCPRPPWGCSCWASRSAPALLACAVLRRDARAPGPSPVAPSSWPRWPSSSREAPAMTARKHVHVALHGRHHLDAHRPRHRRRRARAVGRGDRVPRARPPKEAQLTLEDYARLPGPSRDAAVDVARCKDHVAPAAGRRRRRRASSSRTAPTRSRRRRSCST